MKKVISEGLFPNSVQKKNCQFATVSKCLSKNRMHELEKDQSSGNLAMNEQVKEAWLV
jgi:hypothetical protein